ncbi:hypothetical protein M501DRAFT_1003380 [Patellaria atrata CBS 101060]|uniref:Uncharacterized protein n=1 Tax=Patellaria atrata CBS 101060 TaxID=1346257 RepID=A0A9P4SC41_9PEZI|nr:hypothetical protein M501DRAFT_1003380 [Patellaria atrata CBS 101060]
MTLLLAPWTPAMRLGQGFNSFTQELCVDQAVDIKHNKKERDTSPAQTVSYTARVVDKLSDVIESMNVSYSASIRRGTVEVSGNTNTIDETTFKGSDLNAVVSVKVVNETVSIPDGCKFLELKNVLPGSSKFNEIYGDCYISGYIEGGDFTSIVSVKVLDRSNVDGVIKKIKGNISSSSEEEVNFETLPVGLTDLTSSLKDTSHEKETSISVSWTGGGKIKDDTKKWDLDSAMAAAAAFPSNVAKCPQRTWAILTKYKANRSFIEWSSNSFSRTLDYDQVSSYTAELFDNYMDYKLLLKLVQTIINNRDRYEARRGIVNAIDTSISTLISVRSVLREEQAKIVAAVEVLSKDPGILARQAGTAPTRRAQVVNDIIRSTLGDLAFVPYRSIPIAPQSHSASAQITQTSRPSDEPDDYLSPPQKSGASTNPSKPVEVVGSTDDKARSEASYDVRSINESDTDALPDDSRRNSTPNERQPLNNAPANGSLASSLDAPPDGPPASVPDGPPERSSQIADGPPDAPPDAPTDAPPDGPPDFRTPKVEVGLSDDAPPQILDGPPNGPPSTLGQGTSDKPKALQQPLPPKQTLDRPTTENSSINGPKSEEVDTERQLIEARQKDATPPEKISSKGQLQSNKEIESSEQHQMKQGADHPPELFFNFDALMPPEIWEDLLPKPKEDPLSGLKGSTVSALGLNSSSIGGLTAQFPPPPDDYIYPEVRLAQGFQDELAQAKKAQNDAEAAALAAKATEQQALQDAQTAKAEKDSLNIDLSAKLAASEAKALSANQEWAKSLERNTVLQREVEQLRAQKSTAESEANTFRSKADAANNELMENKQRLATVENSLQQAKSELLPREPDNRVWIASIYYGNKFYHDAWLNPNDWLKRKFTDLAHRQEWFQVGNDLFGEDPLHGQCKQLVVTYRYDGGRLRWASAVEGQHAKFDPF